MTLSFSGSGSGYDGGHSCCHAVRNDKVGFLSFHFFFPTRKLNIHLPFVYSEPNSSTMRNDLTRNIEALSTERLPLSDRKVFLASIEVSSLWYVKPIRSSILSILIFFSASLALYLWSPSIPDDASRSELRRSVYDICHSQAVRARHRAARPTTPECNNVWDWRDCGISYCLYDHATRVRIFLPSILFLSYN